MATTVELLPAALLPRAGREQLYLHGEQSEVRARAAARRGVGPRGPCTPGPIGGIAAFGTPR
jgi:hypothetical protein